MKVVKEGDHGINGSGNPCVDDRVNMFLATGSTVTTDVTCEGLPIPAPGAKAPTGRSVQEQWAALAAGLRF
ncbi:MAG TPA: alpha/beta hydrolase [Tetrasphaera sp.]|uniref:alpha/beta hydrolase n=1 Tax=Nostocoides sp. TaxID=1917966 RepID=UPI002BA5DE37|nr:alpha/beta hydrolase [Tetrasphaera sp.]HNQ08230.1 alpha/beta hydrolase [Tetrasphaera sp.]